MPENIRLNLRLPEELHERLKTEADARLVSPNYLVNRAVADFLDRLIPIENVQLTIEDAEPKLPT